MTEQGLNGEKAFEAKDVLVGYVPGGSYGYTDDLRLRVTVSVRMEYLTRQDAYETTEHKQVSRPLDFALSSDVWRPDLRDITSGGAGTHALEDMTRYAKGWDAARVAELRRLGEWHLNGMTAGCAHQVPVTEKDRYGREITSLTLTPACPVTGYRYGHAWLVRELPAGFLARVQGLFS